MKTNVIEISSQQHESSESLGRFNSIINYHTNNNDNFISIFIGSPNIMLGTLGLAGSPFSNNRRKLFEKTNWILINKEAMPHGELKLYNEGKAAIGELGHWLGLYKTFSNKCDGPGDYVEDTPAHPNPTFNQEVVEACLKGEYVPIHNYMNYSPDSLMNEFTRGQVTRMKICLVLFRNQFLEEKHFEKIKI